MIKVKFSYVDENARNVYGEDGLKYQHDGDACFDLKATKNVVVGNSPVLVPLGVRFEIPKGYVGKLYVRSSTPLKKGIMCANSVGIIDSGYRGEVKLIAVSADGYPHVVNKGDRIAQMEIVPVLEVELVESAELSETERGEGGFGSTGVK